MGYGNTDSGGTKVIVIALAVLVVVAFVIGGILLGNLQGFIPSIVEQRVREGQIANDKSAEELRHQKAQNVQAEQNATDAAKQQSAWNEMVLDVARELGMQMARALPWAFVIACSGLTIRFVLPALQLVRAKPALQRVTLQPASASPNENSSAGLRRPQTPLEKEAHRFERELARQRERRDRALVLRVSTNDRSNGNRRAA